MSLKTPKSLLIIGAVVVALLAGTILLGNYANILPAGSDTSSQPEAQNVKACPREAAAGFDAKTCPLGRTEPCCAEEAEGCCCPKKAEGCCPKEAEGCCPKEAEGCCPKEAEGCCPKEAEGCCPAEAKPCCP